MPPNGPELLLSASVKRSDSVELSLSEVEALAQSAARGGGYSWGLADDAGRSARWLAAHGCDWGAGLLALLDTPPPAEQCPLRLGCFLADSSAEPGEFLFRQVERPVWLLAPLLPAAMLHDMSVVLTLGSIAIAAAPRMPLTASVPWSRVVPLAAARISARIVGDGVTAKPHPLSPGATRCRLPAATLGRLVAYGARTYVPASEQSRMRGAGSLTRDDD